MGREVKSGMFRSSLGIMAPAGQKIILAQARSHLTHLLHHDRFL